MKKSLVLVSCHQEPMRGVGEAGRGGGGLRKVDVFHSDKTRPHLGILIPAGTAGGMLLALA